MVEYTQKILQLVHEANKNPELLGKLTEVAEQYATPTIEKINTKKVMGERIAEYRKKKQLSRHELSSMIGVSDGAIGQYENGVSYMQVENLIRLVDTLDVSMDYIFGRDKYVAENIEDLRNRIDELETELSEKTSMIEQIKELVDRVSL